MAMDFDIELYENENSSCPVKEFIDSLDNKMKARVIRTIELLEKYGNQLRLPYSKSLGDGIFELRCQQSNNITRILYFFYVNQNIVMTNGFTKKTQKTPRNEIELAKTRRKDYLERHSNQSK